MSDQSQSSKLEPIKRSTSTQALPIAVAAAPRLPPRQPDVFAPGDDFDLWEALMRLYLRDVPARDHLQYIVSFLNKDAAKQFFACKLPDNATPSQIWDKLRTLFAFRVLPATAMDQLFNRKQRPGEPIRAYASALQQLAVLAFPDRAAADRDQHILERFITGVSDPTTRSKFFRKPPSSLEAAIQKALDFEAIAQMQQSIEANVTLSAADHRPQPGYSTYGPRNPSRRGRGTARTRCPYCRRFGARARACGHNRPRPAQITGEYFLPTLALNGGYSVPCLIKGTLDDQPVEFLIDTGATCSILRCDKGNAPAHQRQGPQLITAGGSTVPTYGKIHKRLRLGTLDVQHNFLLAPITRDAIIGMDILRKYGAQIDAAHHTIKFCPPATCAIQERDGKLQDSSDWAQELLSRSGADQTAKNELLTIIRRFSDVFGTNHSKLGRTTVLQHHINTGDHPPLRQPPRRIPIHYQPELERMIQDMLDKHIIRPSSSPWAAPIVLVKKKDGSLRLCIDYRRLNAVTKRDSFPLPRIDVTIDATAGAQWYSTLDLESGYWQVEVYPPDRAKTAFVVPFGLYEFITMPFGLTNAPATFQRLMQTVLSELVPKHCLIYLDDIIVHGRTIQEHNERLVEVLTRLRDAGLTVKAKKCQFLQQEVLFLGHKLSAAGVQVDSSKTARVRDWPTPKDAQDVRRFMGLASYYRKFVRNFAAIASPLHRLTEKGRPFLWTTECTQAFTRLKQLLSSAPILALPVTTPNAGRFILDTDASDLAIGAILSQEQNGQEKVIAYASRTLDKRERNYCTTRREMLALVYFLGHFRPYLLGRPFIVRTDHRSLQWLKNFRDPQGQIARWQEKLQDYDFVCEYRSGKHHGNADALSRLPGQQTEELSALIIAQPMKPWGRLQAADPDIGMLYARQKNGEPKPTGQQMIGQSTAARSLWNLWPRMVLIDDALFIREDRPGPPRLVVPRIAVEEIVQRVHRDIGHGGQRKTEAAIRQRYWWALLHHDVLECCRTCDVCQRTKTANPTPCAPLMPLAVEGPNHRVGVDIIGPMPVTRQGNRYVLVMVDYFTKWCEASPIKQQDARSIATAIINDWICRYGVPVYIHSDQGAPFESHLMGEICTLLHIEKTRTSPYHPQGNGLVERTNRSIKTILQTLVDQNRTDQWDEYIPKCLLAYRASLHSTTGFSPALLQLGRELRLPSDIAQPMAPAEAIDHDEYVRQLHHTFQTAFREARAGITAAQGHQKAVYDRKVRGPVYKIGDYVLLHRPKPPPGVPAKIHSPWQGPYVIVFQRSPTVFAIRDPAHSHRDVLTVHYNQLKPYTPPSGSSYLNPIPPPSPSSLTAPSDNTPAMQPRDTEDSVLLQRGEQCSGIESRYGGDQVIPQSNPPLSLSSTGQHSLNELTTDGTTEEEDRAQEETEPPAHAGHIDS